MNNVAVSFYETDNQMILGAQAEVLTAFGLHRVKPSLDMIPVVVQPKHAKNVSGIINLFDFVHPQKAYYLFGPDHRHLLLNEVPEKAEIVYIEQENEHACLYSYQAAAVVLCDRMYKYRHSLCL